VNIEVMAPRTEDPNAVSDERLLELAQGGADGFATFYRRNVPWVLRFCARRTRDPEVAADLTAEVFAAALLAVRRYRRERGTARNWLLGIAIHKLANLERDGAVERRARQRLGIDVYALSASDRADFDELLAGVDADEPALELLGSLPADQLVVVRARVIDGRSYSEVASSLGISEATARKRVSRGLAAIREQIGGAP
jgi:RNA polymerase sigma factor (sigma-70 family)